MNEGKTYFAGCVRQEQNKLRERISWESRAEWPQPSLVKELRRFFAKCPTLASDIGGVSGAVDSLKSAARGDQNAERVRKMLVRYMCEEDTDDIASRRVLRSMLDEQAASDKYWSRMPIRVYGPDAALAPCISIDGTLHTRKEHLGDSWAAFDAAWLWKKYCVYGWHRWAQDEVDVPEIIEMIRRCSKTEQSLYLDKPPAFVLILHGDAWEKVKSTVQPSDNMVFAAPWEISEALAIYKMKPDA